MTLILILTAYAQTHSKMGADDTFSIPPLPPPHYVGGSLGLKLREALKTHKGYAVLTNPEKP